MRGRATPPAADRPGRRPAIRGPAPHADGHALAECRGVLCESLQRLIARRDAQTWIELRCGDELPRSAGRQMRAHEWFCSGLEGVERLGAGKRGRCEQRAEEDKELRTDSLHDCGTMTPSL